MIERKTTQAPTSVIHLFTPHSSRAVIVPGLEQGSQSSPGGWRHLRTLFVTSPA